MFDKLPYLHKRYNKYHIRIRVPDEVRDIIGKQEITRSLGTGDPVKAKPIYHEKVRAVLNEIEAARKLTQNAEPTLLPAEMAERLARSHFQEAIYAGEELAHRAHNTDGFIQIDEKSNVLIDAKELHMEVCLDLRDIRAQGESYATSIADDILLENGFPEIVIQPRADLPRSRAKRVQKRVHIERGSTGYKCLLRLSFQGQIEVWERMRCILEGKEFDEARSIFGRIAPLPMHQSLQAASVQPTSIPNAASISVTDLFDKFMLAHDKKSARWKADMRTSMKPLMETVGANNDANSLTKQNFRDLLAFVRRMPAQIGNNKKRWKGMLLTEIVEAYSAENPDEDNLLHPTTVNKYMGRVSQVMQWAENEPLIDRNHARGIRIPADEIEDDNKRRPFSNEQLNTLFSTDPFTDPRVENPSLYWASLLSLFHGLRSEEILQLRYEDIQQDEDGITFLNLHKRNGNHLKNKAAKRTVPVHPFMFTMGFQSLLAASKKNADQQLFSDVERGAEGKFTPAFSRRFSRHLVKIEAKTETTSFHSFRHCFRDGARNCDISDSRACAIGGWTIEKGVHANYGDGLSMEQKFIAIKKLEYPKVDLSKVVTIDWSK